MCKTTVGCHSVKTDYPGFVVERLFYFSKFISGPENKLSVNFVSVRRQCGLVIKISTVVV